MCAERQSNAIASFFPSPLLSFRGRGVGGRVGQFLQEHCLMPPLCQGGSLFFPSGNHGSFLLSQYFFQASNKAFDKISWLPARRLFCSQAPFNCFLRLLLLLLSLGRQLNICRMNFIGFWHSKTASIYFIFQIRDVTHTSFKMWKMQKSIKIKLKITIVLPGRDIHC